MSSREKEILGFNVKFSHFLVKYSIQRMFCTNIRVTAVWERGWISERPRSEEFWGYVKAVCAFILLWWIKPVVACDAASYGIGPRIVCIIALSRSTKFHRKACGTRIHASLRCLDNYIGIHIGIWFFDRIPTSRKSYGIRRSWERF